MPKFEYQVVPAPRKGKSVRKIRGNDAKFANTISELMNEMAADGWEYQRAETLPCEERQGLTGKTVKYPSMLVFRREIATEAVEASVAAPAAAPVTPTPVTAEPAGETRPEPTLTRKEGPASEGFMGDDKSAKPNDRDGVAAE